MIGFGLWNHNLPIILVSLVVDLLNWFLMPMVDPKKEIPLIKKIVQIEIDWIKKPWDVKKVFTLTLAVGLFVVLSIGLWENSLTLLIISFVSIAILKQLLLSKTKL
jgi:hypothetical protein